MSNFLDEKVFQKNKKKILNVGKLIFISGLIVSFSLIGTGVYNNIKTNQKYSEENKTVLREKLKAIEFKMKGEKEELEAKIKPVENEIKSLERVPFTGFNSDYYNRVDRIDELKKSITQDKKTLSYIDEILVHSTSSCYLSEDSGSKLVDEYCTKKEELDNLEDNYNKNHDKSGNVPFFIFGVFIFFATVMISSFVTMFAKRRELLAFNIQQTMPVVQEGMEAMAPTVGNVTNTIIEKVTPTVAKATNTILKDSSEGMGQLAKEIAKGIKEGTKDTDDK